MSEIDSGIEFKQSGNIVKIAGDDDSALCDINAKVGGSIIGVKTVAIDNALASDARVRIGGVTKALKLQGTNYINVSCKDDGSTTPLFRSGTSNKATEDDAWTIAVANWNADTWGYTNEFPDSVWFMNRMRLLHGTYRGTIWTLKSKVTVDLTAYNPADYEVANLVVNPTILAGFPIENYYNNDGWIEKDYNFLEDIKSELGTEWTSTNLYGTIYTPSRPALDDSKGYVAQYLTESIQGFYIMLIPKT